MEFDADIKWEGESYSIRIYDPKDGHLADRYDIKNLNADPETVHRLDDQLLVDVMKARHNET